MPVSEYPQALKNDGQAEVALIYWSRTGNTKAMALALVEGLEKGGCSTELLTVKEANPATLDSLVRHAHALLLGCPAMGTEELEATVFEPFFRDLAPHLRDRRLALFGAYGWGDGAWMRTWELRAREMGALLFEESCIVPFEYSMKSRFKTLLGKRETPDLSSCRDFGRRFADFAAM
jgi:flavorubredoxin